MKLVQLTLAMIISAMIMSCNQSIENMNNTADEQTPIFSKGEKAQTIFSPAALILMRW